MAYIGKTPSQATRSRFYYTATGGETSLSGADDNGNTLVFSDGNYVDVMLNGVNLVADTDYNTTTANTIGGLTALTASDIVEIVVYDTFSVFGGDVKGNFNVQNGTLSAEAITGSGDMNIDSGTLFVDASENKVGIGKTDPAYGLDVVGTVNASVSGGTAQIGFQRTGSNAGGGFLGADSGSAFKVFDSGFATVINVDSSKNLQFNSGYGSVATAYGCRAWVNFDGTGSITINGDGNVSSITDIGTGSYIINFTLSLPDDDYSAVVGGMRASATNHGHGVISVRQTNPTSSTLYSYDDVLGSGIGNLDLERVTFAAFR